MALIPLGALLLSQPMAPAGGVRQVSYDVVPFYGSDTTTTEVYIFYRIAKNFFIFLRDNQSAGQERYTSKGMLVVELTDERTGKSSRIIQSFGDVSAKLPQPDENGADIEGLLKCSLPDGTYGGAFDLRDEQSDRSFLDKKLHVVVERNGKSVGMNDWVLAKSSSEDSTLPFRAINRTEILPFGESGGFMSQVRLSAGDAVSVRWKLSTVDMENDAARTFADSTAVLFDQVLVPEAIGNTIRFRLNASQTPWKSIFIPIPARRLNEGRYLLTVELRMGNESASQEVPFSVAWLNKPFSLSRTDIAIDALRHIATEDEMNDMDSFMTFNKSGAFRDFWRKLDPDTSTAFNEKQAEYYRRVDEAIRQFSSDNEQDGYKTDRGKILILYGAPTKRDRLFSPNKPPTEVWMYLNAKKRFIFIDAARKGLYTLSQMENL